MIGKPFVRRLSVVFCIALTCAVVPCFGGEYLLGTSDRLRIKVQEWPDLTGEYSVDANGAVSLPLIGDIQAAGHPVKDLAQEISARLQKRSGGSDRPFAAIEIVQFRPYTILGDVQKPGEYPFRPGLTVIQAIAVAGGYYRPVLPPAQRLDRDVAIAEGDLRAATTKRIRLLVRTARLQAALDGKDDFAVPKELESRTNDPDVSAVLHDEHGALTQERDVARTEQAALERISMLYQSQIESLQQRIASFKQEKGTIDHQLDEVRALSARGLALSATLIGLERASAQVADQRLISETEILKAYENIELGKQRVRDKAEERNRTNIKDMQQAKDDLAEANSRIKTANDLLDEAQVLAPEELKSQSSGRRPRTVIVLRKQSDGVHEITADDDTPLEPNDVIKVPSARPASKSGPTNVSRLGPGEARP
jgi:exopolysaccharide production protein ExoF